MYTLEELRKKYNLTQSDVAKKLGLHINMYRHYEKGTVNIPAYMFSNICDFYGVSRDEVEIAGAYNADNKNKQNFNHSKYFYERGYKDAVAEMKQKANNMMAKIKK